jgi:hypothetical protein
MSTMNGELVNQNVTEMREEEETLNRAALINHHRARADSAGVSVKQFSCTSRDYSEPGKWNSSWA